MTQGLSAALTWPAGGWLARLRLHDGSAHFEWDPPAQASLSLDDGAVVALINGTPRPLRVPPTSGGSMSAAQALLEDVRQRGVSALRDQEGSWSLLRWDARTAELLVATDRLGRSPLFWQDRDGTLWISPSRQRLVADSHRPQPLPEGQADAAGLQRLPAGSHLRVRADGSRTTGLHGQWPQPTAPMRTRAHLEGEVLARLTSVLRLLADQGELMVLAESLPATQLLALAVRQAGLDASLLRLEGLSPGSLAPWSGLAAELHWPLLDDAALMRFADRARSPALVLSAQGLAALLPDDPGLLQRCLAWRPAALAPQARPAEEGARLVHAFQTRWQPDCDATRLPDGIQWAWPFLDEAIARYLVNLPPGQRIGAPWQRSLRSSLEAALNYRPRP